MAASNPSTATTPTAEKKQPSSRLMQMKFMQKHSEKQLRQKLEVERSKEDAERHWVATAANATPSKPAGSTQSAQPPQFHQSTPIRHHQATTALASSISSSHAPFAFASTPSNLANRTPIFIRPAESSAFPALPYSALTGASSSSSASATPPASSSSSANTDPDSVPLPPFIPGRRSYGQFNPTTDALVQEAKQRTMRSETNEEDERRDKKLSFSDDAMADHYLGLRGKAAATQGAGGHKQQHRSSHKHPRSEDTQRETAGQSQRQAKKQKSAHKQMKPKSSP